jgi:inorganic pyrophosphatase
MTLHLWHNLASGPSAPDVVYVVVEVPKGSRNKYEYSKTAGIIKLDRVLYSPLHYPGDYGFIPRTYFEDGDPMDILVMMNAPTFPGCVVEARPLGMFKMIDRGEQDFKVLAVPHTDPNFDEYHTLSDLPAHFPREVEHFFMVYKELQGAEVKNEGWVGTEETRAAIKESMSLYHDRFPPTGL